MSSQAGHSSSLGLFSRRSSNLFQFILRDCDFQVDKFLLTMNSIEDSDKSIIRSLIQVCNNKPVQ